jgi:hypothetical protein
MIPKKIQALIAGLGAVFVVVGIVLLQSAASADDELSGTGLSFSDCQIGWLAEATNTNVIGIDTSNCASLRSQRDFGNTLGPLLIGLGVAAIASPLVLGRIKSKTVKCKWCAEKVLVDAKVCKHCGKKLSS